MGYSFNEIFNVLFERLIEISSKKLVEHKLFKRINLSTEDFEKKFWKAKSAESFNNNLPTNTKDPATIIFKTAMNEVMKTKRQSSAVQAARVERILEIATDLEIKKIEKNFAVRVSRL